MQPAQTSLAPSGTASVYSGRFSDANTSDTGYVQYRNHHYLPAFTYWYISGTCCSLLVVVVVGNGVF